MESKDIKDIYFYLPIIILSSYFIYRLIDQSHIISTFPLDLVNDWSSYLAQLSFLNKCGFLQYCSYWYNGFISFSATPPGWYFFTYPLLLIFKDVKIAAYISLILMYLISFIFVYLIGKEIKISLTKRIAFFLFFFANAITIGNFIRLGRIVSIFSFVLFIIMFYLILKYKDKKLDYKFYLYFIIIYSIVLLSHFQEIILISLFLIGFFLIKDTKDKLKMILGIIISLVLISFWLVPFLTNLPSTLTEDKEGERWLLSLSSQDFLTNIALIIIPLIFIILFYLYWKTNKKSKKELILFLPLLILDILVLFRITAFIPILKNISPDPYLTLFIFFIIFFFFKIDFDKFKKLKALSVMLILIMSTVSIGINIVHTPNFTKHSEIDKDILKILKKAEDSYLIFNTPKPSYGKAYYSYTPIYSNLSTAQGWYPYLTSRDYIKKLKEAGSNLDKKNCKEFKESMLKIPSTNYITSSEYCDFSKNCGFNKIDQVNSICLYKLDFSS